MAITIRRPRCPVCGAQLRRDRQPGLCGPCERVGPDPRKNLPADFYTRPDVVAWLGGYDFGPFLHEIRRLTGWSQHTLGGVTGLTQAAISGIERGDHRLRDIELIAGLADALRIPPALLNLPSIRATVSQQDNTKPTEVSWVDRRDFGQHIAGLVLGIATATHLDTERLLALLPQAEPTGTRHIGTADVELIEQLTAAFRRQDMTHGAGLIRNAATSQLHAVLPLLNAQLPAELRPRLMLATAHLATVTGHMSHDVKQHDAARRLWLIGLDIARNSEHPLGTDLIVYLLYDMALQAVHLQRPDEALHLVRVGESATVGRHRVSASTSVMLTSIQARAHAAQGDAAACDRALGQAEDNLVAVDPASGPPWATLDEALLKAIQGEAHYYLALTGHDPRAAERAVPLLRHAVDHFSPRYTRVRALRLPDLAAAHALAGYRDTAVTLGHQAIDAVTAVASPRARDRLRTLHTVLEPLLASPGVAELRDRLVVTAA